MTDDSTTDRESTDDQYSARTPRLIADGGNKKVIGKLADSSGVGVYGYATSSTGTTCGVKGEVDSSDGYGLGTPDDALLEGVLDTDETDFVVTAGTTNTGDALNVVLGHGSNVADGVSGATIGGGGKYDGHRTAQNGVYENYGTIGGGKDNTISAENGTIGGGVSNSVAATYSTIGGGWFNHVIGKYGTIAGGGPSDTENAGPTRNVVEDHYGTIGGGGNNRAGTPDVDSQYATVPGGRDNAADGKYSFAAGRRAKTNQNAGTFVWADSTDADFTAQGPDQFLIGAAGGVGINQNDPKTQLHVTSDSGSNDPASITDNTALIEDTSGFNSRALAIKTGNPDFELSTSDHYVTFYNTNDSTIGSLRSNSNAGIELNSNGSDYAEYMPRRNPDEEIEPAEVVGVVGDAVTKRTAEADQAMVVSDRAIVTGNSPGPDPEDQEDHETVAFVGQVPVKVRGPVEAGDLVVPSDQEDGTGRAIAPDEWRPGDGPVVGRAWESDDAAGVSKVTVAVGVDDPTLLGKQVAAQRDRIDDLEAENDEKNAKIDEQRERIDDLEQRLAAIETQLDTTATPADD